MRLYQITLTVPDDFVPDDLQLSAAYRDGEIGVAGEGFIINGPVESLIDTPEWRELNTGDGADLVDDSEDDVEEADVVTEATNSTEEEMNNADNQ